MHSFSSIFHNRPGRLEFKGDTEKNRSPTIYLYHFYNNNYSVKIMFKVESGSRLCICPLIYGPGLTCVFAH